MGGTHGQACEESRPPEPLHCEAHDTETGDTVYLFGELCGTGFEHFSDGRFLDGWYGTYYRDFEPAGRWRSCPDRATLR